MTLTQEQKEQGTFRLSLNPQKAFSYAKDVRGYCKQATPVPLCMSELSLLLWFSRGKNKATGNSKSLMRFPWKGIRSCVWTGNNCFQFRAARESAAKSFPWNSVWLSIQRTPWICESFKRNETYSISSFPSGWEEIVADYKDLQKKLYHFITFLNSYNLWNVSDIRHSCLELK